MNWVRRKQIVAALESAQGKSTARTLSAATNIDQTTLQRELEEMVKESILTKTENEGWRERTGKRCRYSYALENWP